MHLRRQPRKSTGWDATLVGPSPAIRAESLPWMRPTPLIIGLSALLWDMLLDFARWLAALQL